MTSYDTPQPFFSWVGSKRRLIPALRENLPRSYGAYHEPFLGSGALALHQMMWHADKAFYLSDANEELILAWQAVRSTPRDLIEALEEHNAREGEGKESRDRYFLSVRNWDRKGFLRFKTATERAARFLYLTYNSYRAMYKIGADGFCSSSAGDKRGGPWQQRILDASALLSERQVFLSFGDYRDGASRVAAGDLVFLDSPYATDHEDGREGYAAYAQGGASLAFQQGVADYFAFLTKRGAYALLANSDTPTTRALYQGQARVARTLPWLGKRGNETGVEMLFANAPLAANLSSKPAGSDYAEALLRRGLPLSLSA